MRHNVLFATAFATLVSTSAFAADLPGKGITVQPVQSTISEESFQTLIVSRALEKLGYTVNTPSEVDYNVGYTSIASGDATFTAVNWQPLHDDMYAAAGGDKKFYREGTFVTGAAQGYLIDKKTADQYHITNIEQLKDPKIAKLFDTNGDGKADMMGCSPGWGCEAVINHQNKAYGLAKTVDVSHGNYSAMMADTIARFKQEGVLPDMVQIGNEINGGMLWPEGKSWGQNGGEFDRLAGLLKAGISGLRENLSDPHQVKIMLHLAEGTKNDMFRWWFDEIVKRDVPFDVIGLSMYTYWNGPISALKANMDDISRRYDKDVMVVEAAYGYTLENCDSAENSFQAKEEQAGGSPRSVAGQAAHLPDPI